MFRRAFCGLMLFLAAPASAAPGDVADLFPPGTLAYAELNGPAELGPQLTALFKGTPLEDSVPFIHGKKDKAKTLQEFHAKHQLAELALFASPEVLAEFRRLGGVAVGLVGFTGRGEPEVALAVLTGESAAAGLAARMLVTTSPTLRRVAEVSKVLVFQHRQPSVQYDPNGQPKLNNDKPPPEGPYERTYAYTPGLFVVGTSKAAVAPVIKRFLGEEKDALGAKENFKAAAAEYRKPGLFFYADAPALLAKVDAAGKARGEPFESDLLAWLRLTANQKAVKAMAGVAQFRDGGVALTVGARLDPAQKSPLADLLSGPPAKPDALIHAKKPALFAATFNLPTRDRAAAVVGFLDATAKASGELGRLPGDVLKDLEAKQKVPVRELIGKVRAITVVVPAKQDLPKGAKSLPMLVLQLEDAAVAVAWEEMLPKLAAEIAGEKPPAQPSSETMGGVKVHSLPATGLPWKSAVHFARRDAVLAVGQDRKLVGGALSPDVASMIGDKPLPKGELALVGTLNFGELIGAVEFKPGAGPAQFFDPVPRARLGSLLPPEEMAKEAEKARAALVAALGQLPPGVVSVRRAGDELKLEVFQPKVQNGGLTPVVNAATDWFDKLIEMNPRNVNPNYPYPVYGLGR